ncbi:PilT/PilU family type 4a pilus ATPase [uncultured Ferrimonas sp.]|uniref:PilT/PilU family type 4a pilus ATPase n=1 Tax=uncultured Ferrimonas sp. TaxID=432640 RepID=UPI0026097807|nr:PilT/PilU family type 4a pilus ATPase [uncultured Ferrimonas sp.]
MQFEQMLAQLAEQDGSDLYLTLGAKPVAKFQGALRPLHDQVMDRDSLRQIALGIMDAEQQQAFEKDLEMNLAIGLDGVGRFRINIFQQRNAIAIVARNIKTDIPRFDDLGLPQVLKEVIMKQRGLVLFVGGTGSGKSTSLASLIDHRNRNSDGHIITIEDPVEYVHDHQRCIVNQREVGVDTRSFQAALKNTLRQAPDVILIGEIRDQETMEHALAFAETGHLAISTLHANNANQALDRIVNFFPEERRSQLLNDLGNNLQAFVSQRLVPTADGKRCAAVEVMLGTLTVRDKIKKGESAELKEIMNKSKQLGMQTFDGALIDLVQSGRVTEETALKFADSPTNLKLELKLQRQGQSGTTEPSAGGLSLELQPLPQVETEEDEDDRF